MSMGRSYAWGDWKPTATMLSVVVVFAVLNTLTKMAFNQGMHITVLITLRQLTAFLFLAPIAYYRERYAYAIALLPNCMRAIYNT